MTIGQTIQQILVQYGPWMVIGVAVISVGLFAAVFATFLMNELFFKRKAARGEHGHGDHGHGAHH
jgi:putative effector of murein hydrolase